MLYAAMFDHVSLPAKLPFEKEDVGDLPKSSSSQKNENGELLVLSIGAIKQPPRVKNVFSAIIKMTCKVLKTQDSFKNFNKISENQVYFETWQFS
jgi:hypothetical protein